jgi:hypothetical protein
LRTIVCLAAASILCLQGGSVARATQAAAGSPAPASDAATPPAAAPVAAHGVADLAWLAGCWASEGGEPGSEEHWLAPAGGTLLGVSRTVKGGKTVAWEYLQIRQTADGHVDFVANPSGQAQTAFRLVSLDGTAAVFENPGHDFPQRVLYRVEGDLLRARIEGTVGGEARGVDFPMQRRDCEAPRAAAPSP